MLAHMFSVFNAETATKSPDLAVWPKQKPQADYVAILNIVFSAERSDFVVLDAPGGFTKGLRVAAQLQLHRLSFRTGESRADRAGSSSRIHMTRECLMHMSCELSTGDRALRAKERLMDLKGRLSKKERDQLEMLMEARDPGHDGPMHCLLPRVHGFLTAIACGPMVMPSEWIPIIFHDPADVGWESQQQAQAAMTLLMRFHNEIVAALEPPGRRYSTMIDRLGDGVDYDDLANDWCRGYVLGIGMRDDEWNEAMEAPELRTAFLAILTIADPKKLGVDGAENSTAYQALLDDLLNCAFEISEWWRKQRVASMQGSTVTSPSGTVRRGGAKVSVNAPCPCGSGKKYKRCCSTLRAV